MLVAKPQHTRMDGSWVLVEGYILYRIMDARSRTASYNSVKDTDTAVNIGLPLPLPLEFGATKALPGPYNRPPNTGMRRSGAVC